MIQKSLDKKIQQEQTMVKSIEEVKLILDKDAMDDMKLINTAFPQSVNQIALQVDADSKITDTLSKKYEGKVYEIHQIKDICMQYRLRFLPSTVYKAVVPIEVVHELKAALKKEGLVHMAKGTEMMYERNLYIMAPAEMFNIEKISEKKTKRLAEARRLRQLDPALFIRLDSSRFLFVKEWGKSFTPARRILGFFTATRRRLNTLFFLSWLVAVLAAVKGGLLLGESLNPNNIWHFMILAMYIVIAAVFLVSWMLHAEAGFFLAKYKSDKEPFWKVDREYATENNWNTK